MAEILDLLAARDPLPPVRFPNGKLIAVRETDGFLEQLLESAATEPSVEKKAEMFDRAWKYIMPDATPEDVATLTTQDYGRILAHARQNVSKTLELVEANRKNASGGIRETVSGTPPSSPTTAFSPSSPESPAPSGETGTTNVPAPTGRPSSPRTRSKKSSGSTTSSPTTRP